ncbi:MAG TPA: class I SAM-dependent methyltransferase [Candidatus Angelobacter sp.]
MGVASHLGIKLSEYDARIRTFIPDYEEMLDVAAGAISPKARTIVDLGVGSGALAARCISKAKQARIVGIDVDADIMSLARQRLARRATFVCDSFLRAPLPQCDAIVASFALHHVRTRNAKARLYARSRAALHRGGTFITVDCHPAGDSKLAGKQFEAWTAHLLKSYMKSEAVRLLAAWSHEDVYMPMETELALMRRCGFAVEVLWRRGAFAVLMGKRK